MIINNTQGLAIDTASSNCQGSMTLEGELKWLARLVTVTAAGA